MSTALHIRARDINHGLGLSYTPKYALETLGLPSTVAEKVSEILVQKKLKPSDLLDIATAREVNKLMGGKEDWVPALRRFAVDDAVIVVTCSHSMVEVMAKATAQLKARKVKLNAAVGHSTARTALTPEQAETLKDSLETEGGKLPAKLSLRMHVNLVLRLAQKEDPAVTFSYPSFVEFIIKASGIILAFVALIIYGVLQVATSDVQTYEMSQKGTEVLAMPKYFEVRPPRPRTQQEFRISVVSLDPAKASNTEVYLSRKRDCLKVIHRHRSKFQEEFHFLLAETDKGRYFVCLRDMTQRNIVLLTTHGGYDVLDVLEAEGGGHAHGGHSHGGDEHGHHHGGDDDHTGHDHSHGGGSSCGGHHH